MATQETPFDEEGLARFEPIRMYDAPGVVLNQLLEGRGSLSLALRTLSDSPSLSPLERESISGRVKNAVGRSSVTDTLVDLVTNPFVLLLALTSPITAKHILRNGGRLVSSIPKGGFGKRVIDMARSNNLLGLTNSVNNRGILSVLQRVQKRMGDLVNQEADLVHVHGHKIVKHLEQKYKTTVSSLDPMDYAEGGLRDELRLLNAVTRGYHEGRDVANFSRTSAAGLRPSMKATMRNGTDKWNIGQQGNVHINLEEVFRSKKGAVSFKPAKVKFDDPTVDLKGMHETYMQARTNGASSFNYKGGEFRVPPQFNLTETVMVKGTGPRQVTHEIADVMGAFQLPTPDAIPAGLPKYQVVSRQEGQRQWHGAGTYEQWLRNYAGGAGLEYANGIRDLYRQRWYTLTGKESAANEATALSGGRFQVDEDKVLKLYQHISKLKDPTAFGLLDPELVKLVHKGKVSETEFRGYVRDLVERNMTNRYAPRNDFVEIRNGKRIDPNSEEAMAQRLGAIKDPKNRTMGSAMAKKTPNAQHYDPEDLALLEAEFGPSQGLRAELKASNDYLRAAKEEPTFLTMNSARQAGRYARESAGNIAMYIDPVPKDVMAIFNEEVRRLNKEAGLLDARGRLKPGAGTKDTYRDPLGVGKTPRSMYDDIMGKGKGGEPVGGFNISDLLEAGMLPGREAPETIQFMRDFMIPRLTGQPGMTMKNLTSYRALQAAKASADWLAKSPMFSWANDPNSLFGRARASMESFAQAPASMAAARAMSGGVASYLYKTHLSLNMFSVLGQMLQTPSFLLPTLGADAWWHGVKRAGQQLNAYAKERATMAPNISQAERRALLQKHIPLANVDGRDLLAITDDLLDSIDGNIIKSRLQSQRRPGMLEWALLEAPMKFFEKAEVFNRIVTGEATQFAMRRATLKPGAGGIMSYRKGVVGGAVNEMDQIEQMVGFVNYGATPLNTPMALASPSNPLFGIINLASAPIRQFVTFPLRSMLYPFTVSPMLGGGTRSFGLGRFGGPSWEINATVGDLFRIMGTGAVIYEVGKNMLGSDLSQQLGGQAITDYPQKILSGKVGDLLPPIIDIPLDAVTGILQFDDEKLGNTLARLVPSGVALQRLSYMMPKLPDLPGVEIQREYADWGAMREDGTVPIYRSDGTLMEFRGGVGTILRGIGADMGRFKDDREAVAFLIRNRDRMVQMKSEYKNAVLANSFTKAKAIELEFKKAFGMPMNVQRQEWDNAIEAREKSLLARQLERLPNAFESQFQRILSQDYSSQLSPFSSGLVPPPTSGEGGQ